MKNKVIALTLTTLIGTITMIGCPLIGPKDKMPVIPAQVDPPVVVPICPK
jgi:hypothetical protein